MKNKFILGAVSGMSALTLAVPLLAQVSNAASSSSAADVTTTNPADPADHAMMKQPSLDDMISHDEAFLKNIDAAVALQKTNIQKHLDALKAAQSITDPTAQKEAIKKANEDMRAAMQAAIESNPDLKIMMMPFGGPGGPHGGKMGMHRMNPEALAQKLGMTADELKAELDSGKTLKDIAAEKGITLPEPKFGERFHRMMNGGMNSQQSSEQ